MYRIVFLAALGALLGGCLEKREERRIEMGPVDPEQCAAVVDLPPGYRLVQIVQIGNAVIPELRLFRPGDVPENHIWIGTAGTCYGIYRERAQGVGQVHAQVDGGVSLILDGYGHSALVHPTRWRR